MLLIIKTFVKPLPHFFQIKFYQMKKKKLLKVKKKKKIDKKLK